MTDPAKPKRWVIQIAESICAKPSETGATLMVEFRPMPRCRPKWWNPRRPFRRCLAQNVGTFEMGRKP
jgi:hypothetical protein